MKRRVNAKGRSTGPIERVVIIRRSLLHSPQFSALSCSSRALLFELQAMFNGTNNGAIFLSVRDATARLGLADYKAAQTAFDELRQIGWITETVAGCFALKAGEVSRARAWNLNWIDRDGRSVGPGALHPLEYGTLTRIQKQRLERRQKVLSQYLKDYQRGHFAVEDSSTLSVRMVASNAVGVEEPTTQASNNAGKRPMNSVGESTTHLEYHRGVGNAWWGADHFLQGRREILALLILKHLLDECRGNARLAFRTLPGCNEHTGKSDVA